MSIYLRYNTLAAGLQGKLTLVSAPAGFGKTTFLSEGLGIIEYPLAWVTLDEGDNDPARFWSYFITALQTIYPEVGQIGLMAIQSSQIPDIESLLTSVINEIAERPGDIAIVLDDYHVIEAEAIHNNVDFLLEHMPLQMHLVIATRVDPPLPLARLRGRGQLNELRTADLRFTLGETAFLFNEVMNLGLSHENVAVLENRTKGWIASLQMAAISMQGREDIPDFIEAFSGTHHYIMDYLVEEVLQRQGASIQTFLLETSILDRMCGPLCNVVTGRDDAQERLEQLEAANLFLVPLDDDRRWFQYHPLFADLLRSRLCRSQSGLLPVLHHRASEWFEHEGLMTEAIHHALAIEDFERAANLIESVAMPIVEASKLSTVLGWLAKLPEEQISTRPWLCLALACAHLAAGQLEAVEPLLKTIDTTLSDAEEAQRSQVLDEHAGIHSMVLALRSGMSWEQGDIPHTIHLCNEAFEHLPDGEQMARSVITCNLGIAYWMMGELATASHYLDQAITLGQAMDNYYIALIATACKAEIQAKQWYLHQAAETNRHALKLGTHWGGGEPLPATSFAYISLARVLYQWNDLAAAEQHLMRGIELGKQGGDAPILMFGYLTLAQLNHALGKAEAVSEVLNLAKGIRPRPSRVVLTTLTDAWLAHLFLAQGDLAAVGRWAASQEPELNLHSVPDYWLEFPYLTLVRLHIARGEVDEIPELLERLRQKAEAEERTGSVIEILILQSIALVKVDQALAVLKSALSLAEPEGYIRIFVDEGEPMLELLHQARSCGMAPQYVNKLLAAFGETSPLPSRPSSPTLIESLTERELEVLRLIAAGKSNYQIAEELIVVTGTVKTHINNIYGKLNVHSRTQAIVRARELDLL